MALVLSETDYKRLTLFTKITGIFLVAASTMMLVDRGNVVAFLVLLVLGTFVTLAPVPMTVVQPEGYADADDGYLTVDE